MCLTHKTINCKSTEEFIDQIKKDTKDNPNYLIYIATNEQNVTELAKLKSHKIYLYSDIKSSAEIALSDMNKSLVNIVIDLMLMCDSKSVFLSYGVTLIHRLVGICREFSRGI